MWYILSAIQVFIHHSLAITAMTSQATPSHLAQTDHEFLHHAHTVTEHTLAIPIE